MGFSGEEKMVLSLKAILIMVFVPKLLLGLVCLYFYCSPDWFPNGIEAWGIFIILGVDLGIQFIFDGIILGIFGIRQKIQIRK